MCIQGNNDNDIPEFRFDDGTPMSYFNWNVGQPVEADDQHIIMRTEDNYRWDSFKAFEPSLLCIYICEKQL